MPATMPNATPIPTTPRHARRRRRSGFSLVEAVMASLIVGVLTVSALQTVGAAVSARRSQATMRQGDLLARHLLDEILQCRFAEPDGTPAWGREAGESPSSRAAWDDVDDYDELAETTLTDKSGTVVPGSAGWGRRVKVERVQASNLAAVVAVVDTGLKRITVVAQRPGGHQTTLIALRADGGTHDARVAGGTSHITWAGVSIKLGDDGGAASAGTSLLNRPAP